MDQENNTKKTYQEKKQMRDEQKQQARGASDKKRLYKRFLKFFVWAVILSLIGYGLYSFIKKNIPEGEDLSQKIPLMEIINHIAVGATHEEYNSNPPTSGSHYGNPAKPGFRDEVIADGNIIHSMEHGLVWVSYHPRIGEEAKKLRDVSDTLAIIAVREANDTDIAIASWGRLDTFNLEDGTIDEDDLKRIRDFINRHVNKGPERIPGGQHRGI